MNTSASISTASLRVSPALRSTWGLLLPIACMLVGFVLPWSAALGMGTTLNAYDLAEWASLHPVVHAESPTLLTPFLLRSGLALIALAISTLQLPKLIRFIAVCLFGFALLPPFEFLANSADPNYRQLLMIAVITVVIGNVLLFLPRRANQRRIITVALGVVAVVFSIAGTGRMVALLNGFGIAVSIGAGLIIYCFGALWLISASILNRASQNR